MREDAFMSQPVILGAKLRALRRRESLTQAQLAQRLGVSSSYVNLIENNRRPITVSLLLKLAKEFQLDLASFGSNGDAHLAADLREVFGDPMFDSAGITLDDLQELSMSQPGMAKAVLTLYRRYREAQQSAAGLIQQVSDHSAGESMLASNPAEELHDLLQQHGNYFHPIEEAAEELWRQAELDSDDVYTGLIHYLRREHGIEVRVVRAHEGTVMRRYDPRRGLITLSEVLPPRSRRFQLAHQVGLLTRSELFDQIDLGLRPEHEATRALLRVVLANYFAAAVLMPYPSFHHAATEERYDIELLAHRYRTSFEQVCHRMTTLQRPGMEGIPLHFIRIDIAGNISKRFSGSGICMPRFSGACPRWNVHAAFLTPGMFRVQLSRMPDSTVYFCVARTVQRATGGYNIPHTVFSIGVGCEARYARQMVYSDGMDLDNVAAVTPVGVTCRTCEHTDCEQRVFPPMQHPLKIDENVRGMAFYAPVTEPEEP
jgi:hypothetical protein